MTVCALHQRKINKRPAAPMVRVSCVLRRVEGTEHLYSTALPPSGGGELMLSPGLPGACWGSYF